MNSNQEMAHSRFYSSATFARRFIGIGGLSLATAIFAALATADTSPSKQLTAGGLVTKDTVEWKHLGGSAAHTRYSPADEINAKNFETLKPAWVWDGASFKAQSGRSTPTYMDGKLFTVAGERRSVVAIDPATGETIWSYREPTTPRYDYSMRKDYGKGVGFAEINGRGVVYIISPAFFLTAL